MNQQVDQEEMRTLLDVSRPTMQKLIQSGLPHWKAGCRYRFDPDEVQAWLRRSENPDQPRREKRSVLGQQARRMKGKQPGAAGGAK